jgi:hypothetical protein
VVWRILAAYLINVRKLSDKESFDIIRQWLLKCNEGWILIPIKKLKKALEVQQKATIQLASAN